MAALSGKLSWVFGLSQRVAHHRFLNSITNAYSNISAHYDLTNDMFAGKPAADKRDACYSTSWPAFLSEDMLTPLAFR